MTRPVAIVGAGPSLFGVDLSVFQGDFDVIAVKQTVWDLPQITCGFGLDLPWIRRLRDQILEATSISWVLAGEEKTRSVIGGARNVDFRRRIRGEGLCDDPEEIMNGGTSGYGAVNLAYHWGSPLVVLFGFDYSGAQTSQHHYNNRRYWWHQNSRHCHWSLWARAFDTMAPQLEDRGIRVLNACPTSAVTTFPRITIDEGLQHLHRF